MIAAYEYVKGINYRDQKSKTVYKVKVNTSRVTSGYEQIQAEKEKWESMMWLSIAPGD